MITKQSGCSPNDIFYIVPQYYYFLASFDDEVFPLALNVNESLVLLLTATAAAAFPIVNVIVSLVDSITAIDLRRVTSSRALFSVTESAVRSALRRLVGEDSEIKSQKNCLY